MKLLITPAIRLNERQRQILEKKHELFFLEDERIPITEQKIDFIPQEIEGIVCNFFFMYNSCDALPNLKFIQLTSVGLDRVPLEKIKKRGIMLHSAGSVYAVPMAEWAVGKVLEIYKFSNFFRERQKEKKWEKNRDIKELAGNTALILGFGNVGKNIAKRLKAFGVNIWAVDVQTDKSGLSDLYYDISALEDIVGNADVIFVTLPLTDETFHIIGKKIISRMKEDVVLINVARGAVIEETALIQALKDGRFLGVALDVFEREPLEEMSELWNYDRVILTPHNSFVGNGNDNRIFSLLETNLNQ